MPIAVDTFNSSIYSGGTITPALAVTTTFSNDILIFIAGNNNNANALSSVASTPALIWNKRYSGISPGGGTTLDVYWALAPTAQAYSVTGNYPAAINNGGVALYAINGATSLTAPFDPAGSLPTNQTANSGVTGITTQSSSGLLIGVWHTSANTTQTMSAGWTNIKTWAETGGTGFLFGDIGIQAYSSAFNNAAVTLITGSFFSSFFLDAIYSGSLPPPPPGANAGRASGFKWWWRKKSGLLVPARRPIIPAFALARG